MKELDKYDVYKKKLNGVCEKNGLTYSIRNREYPFLLTIKPLGGMEAQQTMLEGMEDSNTGYISPDASLVFAYKDGALTYKFSETFTLGDELFSKIKNLFKNLHFMWMQHFFRDFMETYPNRESAPQYPTEGAAEEPYDEDTDAAFDEFMDEAEDAVDDIEDEDEDDGVSGLLEDE